MDYRQTADAPAEFEHYFCGPQEVPGAHCPCCQRPFVRFLGLDTRDPRLNLQDSPFPMLSLFICMRCGVVVGSPAYYHSDFFYRVLDGGGIQPVNYVMEGRKPDDDFPYENYPPFFPRARAVLWALSTTEQDALTRYSHRGDWQNLPPEILAAKTDEELDELRNEDWWYEEPYHSLAEIRHQVGGEPFLIQGLSLLKCPDCGCEMPFLASVADDCLDPRGIWGWEDVQIVFHYCRRCHIVGAYAPCG